MILKFIVDNMLCALHMHTYYMHVRQVWAKVKGVRN